MQYDVMVSIASVYIENNVSYTSVCHKLEVNNYYNFSSHCGVKLRNT